MVVDEIRAAGGRAAANYDSVENGELIIDTAIREFGRVDILLNNAGILRDVSFKNMSDEDWDLVIKVHVKGAYKVRVAYELRYNSTLAKRTLYSVQEQHGPISGNSGMAESLIPRRPQVSLGALASATTLVSNTISVTLSELLLIPYSCKTFSGRLYRDISKGGLQIQHPVQRHCSHRGQQDDTDCNATRHP